MNVTKMPNQRAARSKSGEKFLITEDQQKKKRNKPVDMLGLAKSLKRFLLLSLLALVSNESNRWLGSVEAAAQFQTHLLYLPSGQHQHQHQQQVSATTSVLKRDLSNKQNGIGGQTTKSYLQNGE